MKAVEPSRTSAETGDVHKMSVENIEDFKEQPATNGDYAGAAAKTDPVEIALVKKLDWRIMVSTVLLLSRRTLLMAFESPRFAPCTF
jgi:hypothetical protein